MQVLVFKTDIAYRSSAGKVVQQLTGLPGVLRCNVDLHDSDRILRVESAGIDAAQVEQLVQSAGHFCRELND